MAGEDQKGSLAASSRGGAARGDQGDCGVGWGEVGWRLQASGAEGSNSNKVLLLSRGQEYMVMACTMLVRVLR